MDLNLLEISGVQRISKLAWKGIKDLIQDYKTNTDFQIYHSFRTVGENKLLLIVKGDVDLVVDSINDKMDRDISVSCTPLGSFENFARRTLAVDEDLCVPELPEFEHPKTIFYIKGYVDHPDMSTDEYYQLWKLEAETGFKLRQAGILDFKIYKVTGKRQVVMFFNLDSGADLDDSIPKLPLVQKLGSSVNHEIMVVKYLL